MFSKLCCCFNRVVYIFSIKELRGNNTKELIFLTDFLLRLYIIYWKSKYYKIKSLKIIRDSGFLFALDIKWRISFFFYFCCVTYNIYFENQTPLKRIYIEKEIYCISFTLKTSLKVVNHDYHKNSFWHWKKDLKRQSTNCQKYKKSILRSK